MQYLSPGFYPMEAPLELTVPWRRKFSRDQITEKLARKGRSSLREIARQHGLSHEPVRSAPLAAHEPIQ